jgi:uncharacterized membrane protein (UPF0127 family)
MPKDAPSVRFSVGLVVGALSSIACPGCERRVDEPPPQAARPVAAVPPIAPTAELVGDKPWGKRCVRESPKLPQRPVPKSPDPACPKDPEVPPALRTGRVTFEDAQGMSITVEITQNDHDRQRGLMYRKSMADDHGMIFWFEEKSNHAFWMHNTCIPLDMLYIDDDGLIVGIEENTPTLSDDTFEVGCASKYVLEVNAGWTRSHAVKAGQRVRIEGI